MAARFAAAEVRDVLRIPGSAATGSFSSVSTDTRDLSPGALFVALQGEHFDGADFLREAALQGALAAVVPADRPGLPETGLPLFPVPDTTVALGDLARHYRRRCGARVMGVTGSSGKTTVKEMLSLSVASDRRVHATEGNLNNQVGLPLSILSAPEEADVWVLEMGSSEPGEIGRLTAIAEPDDAVVTTVGPAHLEGFGDVSGVLREKLDLVRGASRSGAALVGELPEALPAGAREVREDVVTAGLGRGCDFRPDDWSFDASEARFRKDGTEYSVPAGGEHHLRDAVIAIAAALAIGVGSDSAARGLASYQPVGLRGALRHLGGLTLVADCYNANPESFEAAIRYCAEAFPGRRLAAVVGTMLEMGDAEADAHSVVARSLIDAGFGLIVAIGAFESSFRRLSPVSGTDVQLPSSVEEAGDIVAQKLRGDEVVLVKASRGVRLERVIDRLETAVGGGA
jgi:UDP-N-acetylmuramoyl-tripeptide--D-alanyl-D-alanine ligase